MSTGWKWALGILGLVLLLWMCNSWANDAAREDTQAAREARMWSEALRQATSSDRKPTRVAETTRATETTVADLTVWRFCSGAIAGTLTTGQATAVYLLDTGELNKHRDHRLRVVLLSRRLVDEGGKETALDLYEACQELRRVDWEQSR